jgi:hypothetical protein
MARSFLRAYRPLASTHRLPPLDKSETARRTVLRDRQLSRRDAPRASVRAVDRYRVEQPT